MSFLRQRLHYFNPPAFNPATNTVLGTTQRWAIDRTWPIEEIIIIVNYDVTTGFTTTNASTPDQLENILSILQRINLSITDQVRPRSVVDCSGVALLHYASQVGYNLDEATLRCCAVAQNPVGALAVPVGRYRMVYRLPMCDPQIGEPMRSRMYLPAHLYPQDPVLTLTFNTIAGMSATATGAIGNVRVEVVLIRREATADSEAWLRANTDPTHPTGYIDSDLIETPFAFALGSAAETRIPLSIPGSYLNLLFRQYKGGAAPISNDSVIDVDVGDVMAAPGNLGNETRWRLETGLEVIREWRWKHLQTINDWTRPSMPPTLVPLTPFVAATSAGSPTSALTADPTNFPSGLQGSISYFRAPTSTMLNFLTDGVSGDNGNELGGVLDCNKPNDKGLKMEIIGTPASVATNPSYLYIMGRRLFGDLSRYQKF